MFAKACEKIMCWGTFMFGNRWTWPGNLRDHLAASRHAMPRELLATMDRESLIKAHDAWHDFDKYGTSDPAEADRRSMIGWSK